MAKPGSDGARPPGQQGTGPDAGVAGEQISTNLPPGKIPQSLGPLGLIGAGAKHLVSAFASNISDPLAAAQQSRNDARNVATAASLAGKGGSNYVSFDPQQFQLLLNALGAQGGGPVLASSATTPVIPTGPSAGLGTKGTSQQPAGGPAGGGQGTAQTPLFVSQIERSGYGMRRIGETLTSAVGGKVQNWLNNRQGNDPGSPVAGVAGNVLTGALRGAFNPEGMIGGVAGSLSGAGLLGAAAATAGIGAVAYGASKIPGAMADQRAANAQYQNIYGGSNLQGMGQRALQFGYQFSQLGTLQGGAAAEIFQGVSQLGMQGGQRQNAVDFAVQQFKDTGASIADTLGLITVAAKNGNAQLLGLGAAMSTVTAAAKGAGLNVGVSQRALAQSYGSVAATLGGGNNSTAPIAANITAGMANLGRPFQGLDTSGMTTDTELRQLGALNGGQSLGQVQAEISGPGGALKFGVLQEDAYIKALATSGWLGPAMTVVQQWMASKAGTAVDVLNPRDAGFGEMAEMLKQTAAQAGGALDVTVLISFLKIYVGITVNDSQARLIAVQTAHGKLKPNVPDPKTRKTGGPGIGANNPASAAAAAAVAPSRETLTPTGNQIGLLEGKPGIDPTGKIAGSNRSVQEIMKDIGVKRGTEPTAGDTGVAGQARQDYATGIAKGNQTDPIMEAILKDWNSKSNLYRVQTKGGGTALVGVDDLVKYYGDQVAAGTVVIAKGKGQGDTVLARAEQSNTSITAAGADTSTAPGGSATRAAPSSAKADTAANVGGQNVSGTVNIAIDPKLANYLYATWTNLNPSSLIPPPTNPTPSQRAGSTNSGSNGASNTPNYTP